MVFKFLGSQRALVLPMMFLLLAIGCTKQPENTAADGTSTETTEATGSSEITDPASLVVGNWKAIVDMSAGTEGLSEEEKQYFAQMMSDVEFIMKFTEDGQVFTSIDDETAPYEVEGDEIIIDGERGQLTVTDTELAIETNGEVMRFSRTDKDVSEVADIESQIKAATDKMTSDMESDIGSVAFKEAEAQTYAGAMNRSQEAYYLENAAFATTVEDLYLELTEETEDYQYSIQTTDEASFNYAVSKNEDFKSFVGGVFAVSDDVTEAIVCVADTPGPTEIGEPSLKENEVVCPKGTTKVE
ncbi:MAG: type IV pilin-like G/H family protein [Cyanobacteriota bacterium]|nr:type IV pilin-like G/H family protein [Cyanobacteriota bacterium]